jgi:hypothetical protein
VNDVSIFLVLSYLPIVTTYQDYDYDDSKLCLDVSFIIKEVIPKIIEAVMKNSV